MPKTKNRNRRSDKKVMTREALIIKYLRESKKLSMRRAAKIIGVSDSQISHAENGRMDLKPDFIMKVVTNYGYTYQYFLDVLNNKKEAPEHTLSECIEILKRLDKEKLRTVKAILESF